MTQGQAELAKLINNRKVTDIRKSNNEKVEEIPIYRNGGSLK